MDRQRRPRPLDPVRQPVQPVRDPLRERAQSSGADARPRHDFGALRIVGDERATSTGGAAETALPQAKLTVNQPADAFEREADAVANQVVAPDQPGRATPSPAHPVQRVGQPGSTSLAVDVSEIVRDGLSGGGLPLEDSVRNTMEQRIGHDFGAVRIHTDARASASADALEARAYTLGTDIAFSSGEYQPGRSGADHLLAHELTHVVQQGMAPPKVDGQASAAGSGLAPGRQVVQREPATAKPTPAKPTPGAPPANPFVPPEGMEKLDITQLVTTSMQALTSDMINHAYTNYLAAVNTVKGRMQVEKKQEEDREKATRDLVLGAVLLAAGPLASAAGAAAMGAMPTVRSTLVARVEKGMPALMQQAGMDARHSMWATASAIQDIDGLLENINADSATKAINSLAKSVAGAAAKVSLAGGPYD